MLTADATAVSYVILLGLYVVVTMLIIIIIIRQLIRRRNMSIKSLQRRRTAYATRIKLIKMRHNVTTKTNES